MRKNRIKQHAFVGWMILAALNQSPVLAADSSDAVGSGFSRLAGAISSFFHSLFGGASRAEAPADVEDRTANAPSTSATSATPVASAVPSESSSADIERNETVQQEEPAVRPVRKSFFGRTFNFDGDLSPKAPEVPTTRDGSVQVSGTAPAGVHWLMVHIVREGETKTHYPQTIAWSAGEPFPKVQLTDGAGSYTVEFFVSKSPVDEDFKWLTSTKVENLDTRDDMSALPSVLVQSDSPEIVTLAHRITDAYSSPLQKSHAIHDWVAGNIAYDYVEAKMRIEQGGKSKFSQDALTVLRTQRGVCEGYSNLTAALHRAIGIPARVINGKFAYAIRSDYEVMSSRGETLDFEHVPLHAWNEALIDGRWVSIDTNQDSGNVDPASGRWTPEVRQNFFDADSRYFDFTHQRTGVLW